MFGSVYSFSYAISLSRGSYRRQTLDSDTMIFRQNAPCFPHTHPQTMQKLVVFNHKLFTTLHNLLAKTLYAFQLIVNFPLSICGCCFFPQVSRRCRCLFGCSLIFVCDVTCNLNGLIRLAKKERKGEKNKNRENDSYSGVEGATEGWKNLFTSALLLLLLFDNYFLIEYVWTWSWIK